MSGGKEASVLNATWPVAAPVDTKVLQAAKYAGGVVHKMVVRKEAGPGGEPPCLPPCLPAPHSGKYSPYC